MEQLKTELESDVFPAVGEKAEVADALKSGGQDMEQESADEFGGVEGHQAGRGVVFTAPIEKRDPAIGEGLDAMIGNGHPMRVTAQVVQYRLR